MTWFIGVCAEIMVRDNGAAQKRLGYVAVNNMMIFETLSFLGTVIQIIFIGNFLSYLEWLFFAVHKQ